MPQMIQWGGEKAVHFSLQLLKYFKTKCKKANKNGVFPSKNQSFLIPFEEIITKVNILIKNGETKWKRSIALSKVTQLVLGRHGIIALVVNTLRFLVRRYQVKNKKKKGKEKEKSEIKLFS